MDADKSLTRTGLARRILDSLTIVLFLAVVVAPTVDLFLRPESVRSPEQAELRSPSPKPSPPKTLLAALKYPSQYESYFKDSFGLRDRLLRWNSIVKVFGYGVTPTSEVYFGKQGWIFYTGEHSQDDHRGAYPFTEEGLAKWAEVLERKRAFLESIGSKYLYVVAPDKESVYTELLPDSMHPIGPTRLEQFLDYMKEHAPQVEILDLRETLKAGKRFDKPGNWVYGNLGTHWSGRGSVVALRGLLLRLDQMIGGFHLDELETFYPLSSESNGDSWTTRMYIGDLMHQKTEIWRPQEMKAKIRFEGNFRVDRIRKSELEESDRPRILMMHDSFGPELEQGLQEQCSYLEMRWSMSLAPEDIEAAEPDVYIDLFVERIFNHLDPARLLPTEDFSWNQAFQKSKVLLLKLDKNLPTWGTSPLGGAAVGPALTFPKPRLPIAIQHPSHRISLPALTPMAGLMSVLHLSIDSPAVTELSLYYRIPGTKNFLRRNAYRKMLQPGTNDFYIPLNRAGTAGDLVLCPGTFIGTYQLREFEIRAAKGPK
ncbi:MAG TPA: hypothetical protein VK843_09265 [Planctomycetota bacterium]|nr:hypothetical protein [Planctomycetota bacterium]